jgi:hypothetical protein
MVIGLLKGRCHSIHRPRRFRQTVKSVVGYGPRPIHAVIVSRHVAIAIVADGVVVGTLPGARGIDLPANSAPVVIGPGERYRRNLAGRIDAKIRSLDRASRIVREAGKSSGGKQITREVKLHLGNNRVQTTRVVVAIGNVLGLVERHRRRGCRPWVSPDEILIQIVGIEIRDGAARTALGVRPHAVDIARGVASLVVVLARPCCQVGCPQGRQDGVEVADRVVLARLQLPGVFGVVAVGQGRVGSEPGDG